MKSAILSQARTAHAQADDLPDPGTPIAAGTARIARQRGRTYSDPPLVAAACNAGSPRRDPGEGNRPRTLCRPTGTGRDIDRRAAFFGDGMRRSAADGRAGGGDAPSFAAATAGRKAAVWRPGAQPSSVTSTLSG